MQRLPCFILTSQTVVVYIWSSRGSCVRMLLYYSSAFNTILPHKLVVNLGDLGLLLIACMWISSFLSGHRQRERAIISMALSFSTRAVC